jgi:ATP synthase protein I
MQNAKDMKVLGNYGTIGLEVVLSILFGLWLGTKLDDWLGTKPYMAVLWFAFGCAAAGRSIYRSWKSMQAAAKREEAEQGNPAPLFPDEKSLAWQREEEAARREAEERTAAEKKEPAAETSLENSAEEATKDPRAEKRDE